MCIPLSYMIVIGTVFAIVPIAYFGRNALTIYKNNRKFL